MKIFLLIAVFLISNAYGQNYFSKDSTYIKVKEKTHIFEIIITRAKFEKSKHDTSQINENIIDGRKYWGKDYESVFVFMMGSDGAGGYSLVWHFNYSGDHSYMLPRYDDFMFKTSW